MGRSERAIKELVEKGETIMKAFGNSMLPILRSGSTLRFKRCDSYKKGDIVFCRVRGRIIDAHRIIKTDPKKGHLIANQRGYENGWTNTIYGKVVEVVKQGKKK